MFYKYSKKVINIPNLPKSIINLKFQKKKKRSYESFTTILSKLGFPYIFS